MFTTFASNAATAQARKSGGSSTSAASPRSKRSQVTRACDRCRLDRIKCDVNQTCRNCRTRGYLCSKSSLKQSHLSSTEDRDAVERLKIRVKELEQILNGQTPKEEGSSLSASALSQSPQPSVRIQQELPRTNRNWESERSTKRGTEAKLYYGPSSSLHFGKRISRYLQQALHQPYHESKLQPNIASNTFSCLKDITGRLDRTESDRETEESMMDYQLCKDLSQGHEEYFINLFWQSYHCTIPILMENDFRQEYVSLWMDPGPHCHGSRRSSALVDIVLAISMQYGAGFCTPREENKTLKTLVDHDDTSVAGCAFYCRCQEIISHELEPPSRTKLQCLVLSVVYLCNASFFNTAYQTLAVALCTAYMLGIHHEPHNSISPTERSLRKRIWWTLHLMDSNLSMALGRPFLVQALTNLCTPIDDNQEQAMLAGTQLTSNVEDITWLSFHVQSVKLTLAARAVHVAFQEKCLDLVIRTTNKDIYCDPRMLETLARFLGEKMSMIHEWVQNVPTGLQTLRKGTGGPFSTQRSALEVDCCIPLWLQRQKIVLELLYHDLNMRLLRPFIRFPPDATSQTPLSNSHSMSCLNHAIAITIINHQCLSETDILNGWHQAFWIQWEATLCILGFLIANPVCPASPSARKAIQTAIAVFENLGSSLASSASAAIVTRDVNAQANKLADRLRSSLSPYRPASSKLIHEQAPRLLPPRPSNRPHEPQRNQPSPAADQILPTPPFTGTCPSPSPPSAFEFQHREVLPESLHALLDMDFGFEEQLSQDNMMSFDHCLYNMPVSSLEKSQDNCCEIE